MARTPKAPQPPALAELPSRQFYTLKEAAAELNCIYGRTDIDENYILQLGSMGKVAIQWHFVPNKAGYFLIPQSFDDLEYLDCDSRTKFYHLQNVSIAAFEGTSFFDIGFYDINKIIFQNNLSTSDIFIENAFNANRNYFLKDPLSKNNFFFSLFYINPEEDINIIEIGGLDLNTGIFHSNYYDEDGGKIIKHDNENLIYRFREETFYNSFIMEHKLNIDIHKKDLYVLGYDIDLIKAGKFRDRGNLGFFADKHLDRPKQKQERPSSQRRQVLHALRHMADLNSGRPHSDAEVLLAHAITKGLEMPANPKTVAKHMYPDQNIDDYED